MKIGLIGKQASHSCDRVTWVIFSAAGGILTGVLIIICLIPNMSKYFVLKVFVCV